MSETGARTVLTTIGWTIGLIVLLALLGNILLILLYGIW
jgi:hypothetical protein